MKKFLCLTKPKWMACVKHWPQDVFEFWISDAPALYRLIPFSNIIFVYIPRITRGQKQGIYLLNSVLYLSLVLLKKYSLYMRWEGCIWQWDPHKFKAKTIEIIPVRKKLEASLSQVTTGPVCVTHLIPRRIHLHEESIFRVSSQITSRAGAEPENRSWGSPCKTFWVSQNFWRWQWLRDY